MGRPSKLNIRQWAEIERRHINGESLRALGKEFGVSPGTISERISKRIPEHKELAKTIAYAETTFDSLPISDQVTVRSLADDLKGISKHLISAATYGVMTSHRLAGIAHGQIDRIDDADPFSSDSAEIIKGINALTKTSNDAAQLGIELLKANKDQSSEETHIRISGGLPQD
jgi:hypothetical protein